ncbi:hypothetical protein DPMN_022312 [Dreissena polymorpha]|uniref:Uncharacterized protein n=1 Tax=Dreissena polymorpha TaxID=45954 RepID=A0A9D4SBP6_DREPO|nr:hypothetical protein DPMN_022312 [Dreissena polymorpha]
MGLGVCVRFGPGGCEGEIVDFCSRFSGSVKFDQIVSDRVVNYFRTGNLSFSERHLNEGFNPEERRLKENAALPKLPK